MTYRRFICSFGCKLRQRVVFLTGGGMEVQKDALSLVIRRINRERKERRAYFYLSEIKSEPFQVLNPSYDIIFVWDSASLSKREKEVLWKKKIPQQLLEGFSSLPWQVIILNVDADSEFFNLFKMIYPKKRRYEGCFIDCSSEPADIESFIKGRLNFVSGILLDPSALSLLCVFPYESLFNVFSIMETLGRKEFTGTDLKRLGFLNLVLEERLAQALILRGSSPLLSVPLKNVNARRFLLILSSLLISILRLKTKQRKYSDKTILSFYSKHREVIDNLNIEDLYRHLYLTLKAFCWAGHSGGLYIFLFYW